MGNELVINLIKTDIGKCFISDLNKFSSYDVTYHNCKIDKFLFDGEIPKPTHFINWFEISKYPDKIQRVVSGKSINQRYELKDKTLESNKIPLVIPYNKSNKYNEDLIDSLYSYEYDNAPDEIADVICTISLVCEVQGYQDPPVFNYDALHRPSFSEEKYTITNKNIEHSLINKIITPAPLLPNSPCRISSKEMFDLTRQFIKDNIDLKHATITSDYDFCFSVEKIIPLLEPQEMSYSNVFARTKKERNKIHYVTHKAKQVKIFQMTHDQRKYNGYTSIQGFEAENEWALKERIDTFLNDLITVINKPLNQCQYCNGTGYNEPDMLIRK